MNPIQAKTIAEFLVAEYEAEMPTTVRVLTAVRAEAMSYRPDPLSRTGLGLVRHVALEDAWILNSIADGAFGPIPDDSDACGISTPADGAARFQKNASAALERVRGLSGEQLAGPITFLEKWTMPRVNFLSLVVKHSVHHRGQLSSYIRAMGGKVPNIYGPTADDK